LEQLPCEKGEINSSHFFRGTLVSSYIWLWRCLLLF